MNILFLCTSNKDRSPALEKHFREKYPMHEYRSAGINRHFTKKHGTHLLTREDVEWADLVVCAEDVHKTHLSDMKIPLFGIVIGIGDYSADAMQEYVSEAENVFMEEFPFFPEFFDQGDRKKAFERDRVFMDFEFFKTRYRHFNKRPEEPYKPFPEQERVIREMKEAPIYLKDMSSDSYSDLQNAPAEELLEVAIDNYKGKNMPDDFLIRLGFDLAREGGWEHIAPAWLKQYRQKSSETMLFKSEYIKPEKQQP